MEYAGIFCLVLSALVFHGRADPNEYIEYLPGTLNIILAAPHGGDIEPEEIPLDRDAGCWDGKRCIWSHDCGQKSRRKCRASRIMDYKTIELTHAIREELFNLTGAYPHVVINKLHRRKLDANRDSNQATFQVPAAVEAWETFHRYIDEAKAQIGGPGLFVDIHGHGHPGDRAELGYLIKGSKLDSNSFHAEQSSIRNLANTCRLQFEELLRGPVSLGALLADVGYAALPSPDIPGPDGRAYYSGGYNTKRHGSLNGGQIDAVQIESSRENRVKSKRPDYARAVASAVYRFVKAFYSSDEEALAPAVIEEEVSEEKAEDLEEEPATEETPSEIDAEVDAEADAEADAQADAKADAELDAAEESHEQRKAEDEAGSESNAEQEVEPEKEEEAEHKPEVEHEHDHEHEHEEDPDGEPRKGDLTDDSSSKAPVTTTSVTLVFSLLMAIAFTR